MPPPAADVPACLHALELFLHDQPEPTPVLLKAALSHLQFETIHPFLDGNGRVGRLLLTLLLCEQKVLREPMLYLSLYFKTHRQHYYALLDTVRQTGDWEAWLSFFADAVIATATRAAQTAQELLTAATVNKALGHLEQLGIVHELTAQRRNRVFSYVGYVELLSRGTQPAGSFGVARGHLGRERGEDWGRAQRRARAPAREEAVSPLPAPGEPYPVCRSGLYALSEDPVQMIQDAPWPTHTASLSTKHF